MNIFNQPDSLEIAFQYTTESQHEGFCSDYRHSDIVILTNGSTHQYNITGLQEHSAYSITIVAENVAGKSAPSEVVITTLQAGMIIYLGSKGNRCSMLFLLIFFPAPSGTPREVTLYHITSHPRCLIGAEAEYKGSYTTFMFSCRVIYYVYVFMFYYTTFMFSCIMTS